MQVECIFSNFIAREFINIDNDKIAEFCYERFIHNPFNHPQLPNQYSNQTWFSEQDLTQEPLKELFDIFTEKVNELHHQLGFKDNSLQIINQSWATLNKSLYTSQPHCHPGVFFTGVYYVKCVDLNSPLKFINPIGALPHIFGADNVSQFNNINSSSYAEIPSTGKLLVFPSWLQHYVHHYVSNNLNTSDRISIAFNTLIVKKGEEIPKFIDNLQR